MTFDRDEWLSNRLGPGISTSVYNMVRELVVDGNWCMKEVRDWAIHLMRYDNDRVRQHLRIHLRYSRSGTRGFASARWSTERPSGADFRNLRDVGAFIEREKERR